MIQLLRNNWRNLLPYIKLAGEEGSVNKDKITEDLKFLQNIGIFKQNESGELTEVGYLLFESIYIRCDDQEKNILKNLLLQFPPTLVIQQYFWGMSAGIEQIIIALKTRGYWAYSSVKPLTHFLDLLNYAEIISYSKKNKKIKIIISPDTQLVPNNIYIDPQRPYSNIIWIKRVLAECSGFIYWLDKHFQKEALEWLCAIADVNQISEIRILSLDLGEVNLNIEAKKAYKRFKIELSNKGIKVVWATIDSKLIRDCHDRWILGGKKFLKNLPNVNAISSGQSSEINTSDNYEDVLKIFSNYWLQGKEI